MDLKEIKTIIDLMTRNGLTEFELEKDNTKIRIKRGLDGEISMGSPEAMVSAVRPVVAQVAPAVAAPVASAPAITVPADQKEIKSPMVGTFYRSPSPEAPPYIEIGQAVTEDTVICIIEAMKVMNEIKAEARGVITEILMENAKPVEFGKPLFRIKPAV